MISQVVAISLVIGGIRWPDLDRLALLAMWAVVLFGLASAADYFLKFWRKVEDDVKQRRRAELLALEREKKRRTRRSPRTSGAQAVSEPRR